MEPALLMKPRTKARVFKEDSYDGFPNQYYYGYLGGWLGTLVIMLRIHESWLLDIFDRRF